MRDMLLAYISYQPVQRWGPVSPHGVGTALGFLAGAVLMARRAEPRGIPSQEVYNAVTWGAVGAIIGARGFYVIGHLEQFGTLRDVLAVWEGGLTMFGGFVGGLVLGLGYLYRRGFNIPHAVDAAAPGFVVGVMIGRIGDLIIADHLGERTDFFLGYRIPEGAELAPGYGGAPYYAPGVVVHNTAMYDFAGAAVLLGVIYLLQRRRPPAGTLFAVFAVWYGLQRFAVDFTRNRELIEAFFYGLSGSQWAGLAFAVAGAFWLGRLRRHPSEPLPVPEEADGAEPAGVPAAEPTHEAQVSDATSPAPSTDTPPPPSPPISYPAADPVPPPPPQMEPSDLPSPPPSEPPPPPPPPPAEPARSPFSPAQTDEEAPAQASAPEDEAQPAAEGLWPPTPPAEGAQPDDTELPAEGLHSPSPAPEDLPPDPEPTAPPSDTDRSDAPAEQEPDRDEGRDDQPPSASPPAP